MQLDGTVDSSPIYLHGVTVGGAVRDVFFVTTTYGRTEAVNAANGAVLWRYTPSAYDSYAGSARITNMSPVADPSAASTARQQKVSSVAQDREKLMVASSRAH